MKIFLTLSSVVFALLLNSCTSCSKSAQKQILEYRDESPHRRTENSTSRNDPKIDHTSHGRVIVKMIKESGVYKIKARINGQELEFIFDTGAGMISLSNLEATLLYKEGKISKEDILGKENFQDATGAISEGVIINLKEVTIGDRTVFNIHASVTNNNRAPVLFGQSALEKFGKITIDYANGELIFD